MKKTKTAAAFEPAVYGVNLPGVARIIYADELESTQDSAKEMAASGEPAGTLVIAGVQTKGRGRLGRNWASAPGGLYMSLILRPAAKTEEFGRLSILTAEAVSETLQELCGLKTRIKAPNDVLAWHPRRKEYLKIAGILTETSGSGVRAEWAVLGIGVNLNNPLPKELGTAASVKTLSGREVPARDFLKLFFRIFLDKYLAWKAAAAARL